MEKLIIGTRKSKLALWQSLHVQERLQQSFPGLCVELLEVTTKGDATQEKNVPLPEIGGKGLFTAELEQELIERRIDIAVHSLKDLPTTGDPAFVLGAVCQRDSPWDAFVSEGRKSLMELPEGAVVGSSSVRRSAQIKSKRPDLKIESIRGNVDTRILKLHRDDQPYDAIVLAEAGLRRLGRESEIVEVFGPEIMLPAPGQGAIAVQCLSGNREVLNLLKLIDCQVTTCAVGAERAFLAGLNAGCNTPVAAYAEILVDRIAFQGRCLSPDGSRIIEVVGSSPAQDYEALGLAMADEALRKGFHELVGEGS